VDRSKLSHTQVKDLQLLQPLFEFSGACAGCGETAYIKLLTQLFGDRLYIANATGCSSIYGGNLPTTPYTKNAEGRGPTWANSLFEDNAEFGFGMRIALDQQKEFAETLVTRLAPAIGDELVAALLGASQKTETEIDQQRERVKALREKLAGNNLRRAQPAGHCRHAGPQERVDSGRRRLGLRHRLRRTGPRARLRQERERAGAGYRGLLEHRRPDVQGHAARRGGQVCRRGKPNSRKDLAMEAVSYGSVYVAQVALGGNDSHVVKAFQEAEAHEGPSLIIAYSSCIAHGYDLVHGLEQQKLAVQSGYWPLMRYNPALRETGKNPFQLDSKAPSIRLKEYSYREARYTMLARSNPELAAKLLRKRRTTSSASGASTPRGPRCRAAARRRTSRRKKAEEQNWRPRLPEVKNDRFFNAVSWLEAERPDRGLVHAALGVDRQCSPHGGCRRLGDRAHLALRGAVGA
jgi:pyruvate-ferredoxin/flavodoxin oxidoreductase